MGCEGRRRLVINADDFGRSGAINAAIIQAHQEGVLTTASLMVAGAAADEAVELARGLPSLGVGLHLTLICGRSVLPPDRIPGLVGASGCFSENAPRAGLSYWADPRLRRQLQDEIAAQFDRFEATGLRLDHVNGHLHLHLHPVVNALLCDQARAWGVTHMRLTRDSLRRSLFTEQGRWAYRLSHALIFAFLAARARPRWRRLGIRHTDHVVGLLADGHVDEAFLLRILPRLPPGDGELYCHPSLERFRHEFEALISPRVRDALEALGIQRIRYQDL